MFMLKSTHERILRESNMKADQVIQHLVDEGNDMRFELNKYREQRDAANKRKRDARKAKKVAKVAK